MTICTGCMQTLDEPGEGRVLVVDGGASKRCALLGDILAAKMHRAGFSVSVLSMTFLVGCCFPSGMCSTCCAAAASNQKGDQVPCEVLPVRSLKTYLFCHLSCLGGKGSCSAQAGKVPIPLTVQCPRLGQAMIPFVLHHAHLQWRR